MTITYKDILDMQQKVIRFNEVMGNDVNDKSLIPTHINLTKEESKELLQAYKDDNHEEVIDAIIDIFFTGCYWWVLDDFTLTGADPWFKEGYWTQSQGAIVEDIGYVLDTVNTRAISSTIHDFQCNFLHLIGNVSKVYNLVGAFERVYQSNMSKTCLKKDVDVEKEIEYIETQGRYSDVFAEENGEYVVFKARKDLQEGNFFENGKIVKSSEFVSVEDLGGLGEFIL